MAQIKVIGWDVYGTLISTKPDEATDDETSESLKTKARQGALETLIAVKEKGIIQCTVSDGDLGNLRDNLKEAGIPADFFDNLYKMQWGLPKDYSIVLDAYKIKPRQLLIIGDNYSIDIVPALKQGCLALWVPEFVDSKSQNMDIRNVISQIES